MVYRIRIKGRVVTFKRFQLFVKLKIIMGREDLTEGAKAGYILSR